MSKNRTVRIRECRSSDIIDLRHRVLRRGMPRSTAVFDKDDLPKSIHLAAYRGGRVVGCATMFRVPYVHRKAYKIRGVAVDGRCRNLGLGRRLLRACEAHARANGINLLWCNARKGVVEFYRKLGWVAVSREFVLHAGGIHVRMVRRLIERRRES